MNLLLDTHVLIWWLKDPGFLSSNARQAIADGDNTVYVSAVVPWEIALKVVIGKLTTPSDLPKVLAENNFQSLPITIVHALHTATLPMHHRDPFDRMLVAQALVEGHHLVSRDVQIHKYAVPLILA